jgi:hypothetical protein
MRQYEQLLTGVVSLCGDGRVGDGNEGSEKVVKMICSGWLKVIEVTLA